MRPDELLKQLDKKGYVPLLMHIEDVTRLFNCTEEEAKEVLSECVYMYSDLIEDSIYTVATDLGLEERE